MVAAVAKVKDEVDFIERSVRHMQGQVDLVIVADNNSTDGTRDILEDLDVDLVDLPDEAHYQGRHMTELANRAYRAGAGWVVPFDADEIWYSLSGRVGDVIEAHGATVYPAWIYDHVPTPEGMGWRYREHGLHKVACRTALPATLAEGSHNVTYPEVSEAWDLLAVRHFPYRSVEQTIRKVRNGYNGRRATDLPADSSVHLRELGALLEAEGEEALERVFYDRFWVETPDRDPSLIFDPCPSA